MKYTPCNIVPSFRAHRYSCTANSSHNPHVCCFYLSAKIARVGRDREKASMFRGWGRLCLHAASLSAAEGASASATVAARAARAEAVQTEAAAAADKAGALKRAGAASTDLAASREQAQREATKLAKRETTMGQVDRQQQERRTKMLVRCCGTYRLL